ncbi:MAG: hypothetical protein NTX45_17270 [Proteobacteria bacterium]|nr:hypothetical protein [Pseudomonadota bacterium]
MEAEIQSLRGELGRNRTEDKTAVATAEQASTKAKLVEAKVEEHEKQSKENHSVLSFRGGYAGMTHNRNDELLVSNSGLNAFPIQNETNGGAGWYVGAGLDHRLTNDMWGLTDLVALDGEIMVQYMNFGTATNTLVAAASTPLGAGPGLAGSLGTIQNQVTQFTLAASPKLKFNTGTIFTPWIIPFGLSFNVISPPSSGVTVLNPGLMLGVGGEVDIWKAIVAGVDFRYNFTGGDLNYSNKSGLAGAPVVRIKGVSTDGLTAGGYVGFKF